MMLMESSLHLPIAEMMDKRPRPCFDCSSSFLLIVLAAMAMLGPSWRLLPPALADQPPSNANEFALDVLRHEAEEQAQDHTLWSYSEQKQDDGKKKLFHVYQTKQGEMERLASVNGQPLTAEQAKAEERRIQRLLANPGEIRKSQKKQHEDGEQARKLLLMFPEAFLFQNDGMQGALVRLKFAPNPKFHPSDHAGQVFHHMTGAVLLDPRQKRLAAMDGTLTREVKFFGGVFGHLDQGGTFQVEQQEVHPHVWEVTAMHVHMKGKALFFKTIAVEEDETYFDFQPVSGDVTLAQAAELLKENTCDTSKAQARN
jgi:hypothetical protein